MYNVAENTGFRFDVLDIDDHYDGNGFAAFNALKAAGLLAGAFRMVKTPSGGGMHIYFAASGQRGGSLKKLHVDFKAGAGTCWCLRRRSAAAVRGASTSGRRPVPRSTGRPPRRCSGPPKPYRAPRAWKGPQKHLVEVARGRADRQPEQRPVSGPAAVPLKPVTTTWSMNSPRWPWPPGSARRGCQDGRVGEEGGRRWPVS